MTDRLLPSKQMSLQQQAMSFLSEGLNNGFWSRTKAQDLVRAMLDANWQQPSQVETSAPSRGSIEYAIEVLKRYRDGSDPDCTCDACPQCGRLPAECSGTQCAQTCQCSECDHCRVLAAIDGLKGSPQETAAPETCSHPASTRVQAWKCDQCGHLRESFFQDCRHGHAAKNHTCGPECSPVETSRKLPPREFELEAHQGLYAEKASADLCNGQALANCVKSPEHDGPCESRAGIQWPKPAMRCKHGKDWLGCRQCDREYLEATK